jgi:hypothetical protein
MCFWDVILKENSKKTGKIIKKRWNNHILGQFFKKNTGLPAKNKLQILTTENILNKRM